MVRPTKFKAHDYENRYLIGDYGDKACVKKNKKQITRYERTLLKREAKKEINSIDDL